MISFFPSNYFISSSAKHPHERIFSLFHSQKLFSLSENNAFSVAVKQERSVGEFERAGAPRLLSFFPLSPVAAVRIG